MRGGAEHNHRRQMSYSQYPNRDPAKDYFTLPNEIYYLGLTAGAIAVYGYLLHIEDRKTYQARAKYKTIGKAVRMSVNTVARYVRELEDKRLIWTEPTSHVKGGQKYNGSLLYHIRPIQEAVDCHNERQMQSLEAAVERQTVQAKLSASRRPQGAAV